MSDWVASLADKAWRYLLERMAKPAGAQAAVSMSMSLGSGYSMKKLTLQRTESGDEGTFGFMSVNGLNYQTLELPDRDNQPGISCIPAGEYQCNWEPSPRLGRHTYRLVGVPGRSGVLFHPANFAGDITKGYKCELNGCIALGLAQGFLSGQRALLQSRDAIRQFEEQLGGESFVLTILPEFTGA